MSRFWGNAPKLVIIAGQGEIRQGGRDKGSSDRHSVAKIWSPTSRAEAVSAQRRARLPISNGSMLALIQPHPSHRSLISSAPSEPTCITWNRYTVLSLTDHPSAISVSPQRHAGGCGPCQSLWRGGSSQTEDDLRVQAMAGLPGQASSLSFCPLRSFM